MVTRTPKEPTKGNEPVKKYKIKEIETGEVHEWTLPEILEEINRDRSDEWSAYDDSDWREGWDVWCEGDYYHLID